MEITTEQAKEYYKNKFKKTLSKDMIHEYASEFANHILKEYKEKLSLEGVIFCPYCDTSEVDEYADCYCCRDCNNTFDK